MQGKQRFLGESTAMKYLIEADNNAGLAWERLRAHRDTYKGVRQVDRNAEHYLYALYDIRSRDGAFDKSFAYNSYQFILTPGYELAKATTNGAGKVTKFVSGKNISPFSRDNPATFDEYLAGYYGAEDALYGIREL